jgi:hypothetical protein
MTLIKNIIAWLVAFFIASIFFFLTMRLIGFFAQLFFNVIMLVPIFMLAFPVYLIIRKKFTGGSRNKFKYSKNL